MYRVEIPGCLILFLILVFIIKFAKELFYLALALIILVIALYYLYLLYQFIQNKKKEQDLCNPEMGEVYKICPYCNASVKVSAKTCPNCNRALN